MQRKQARENAFMLIFESVCKIDETAEEIFTKATEIRGLEYDQYVSDVFFGSYENAQLIDEKMEKHLKGLLRFFVLALMSCSLWRTFLPRLPLMRRLSFPKNLTMRSHIPSLTVC